MAINLREASRLRTTLSRIRAWPLIARVCLMSATSLLGYLGYLNWQHAVLRLTSVPGNRLALMLALLIPWLGAWAVWPDVRGWRRVAFGLALLLPLGFATATASIVGMFGLPTALFDPSHVGFDPVQRVTFPGSAAVLYLTNCGAPCSFGLVLRHERSVVPGLLLVRDLADWYPADSAVIQRRGQWDLKITVAPYGTRELRQREEHVVIKPWVYF
jgi:hypothetical protein